MAQDWIASGAFLPSYQGTNGAKFSPKPVWQGALTVSGESGYFATAWFSVGLDEVLYGDRYADEEEFDDEVDLIAGRVGSWGRCNYSVDLGYYFIRPLTDVLNANAQIGCGPQSFQPFFRGEVYSPSKSGGPKKGLITALGLEHNFQNGGWSLLLKEWLKHDSGAFGFDSGYLAQGFIGVNFTPQWNEGKLTIKTGLSWSAPLTVDDSREEGAVWNVGFQYLF